MKVVDVEAGGLGLLVCAKAVSERRVATKIKAVCFMAEIIVADVK